MHFGVTQSHIDVCEGIARLLDGEVPAARSAEANAGNAPAVVRDLWDRLAPSGVFAVGVPAARGGVGLDIVGLTALAREVGRRATPGPVVDTLVVSAPVLAEAEHALADDVAAGRVIVATGIGRGTLVADADVADAILLADAQGLVLHRRAEVRLRAVDAVDPMRTLARVEPTGTGERLPEAIGPACGLVATVATAAELVGLATAMLDQTVAYVGHREQFGRPVGSFQAIKHRLADAKVAVSFAWPAVLRAAWSLDQRDRDAVRDASIAKAVASDAAGLVAGHAIQCHGAMGYTTEGDLHLFAKRAWALRADRGTAREHRRVVARSLGLAPGFPVAQRAETTGDRR